MIVSAVKKAEMNFTQSMGFAEGLYAITITLHIAQLSFACRCHETGLIPIWLNLYMIISCDDGDKSKV